MSGGTVPPEPDPDPDPDPPGPGPDPPEPGILALTFDDAVSWNNEGTLVLYSGIRDGAVLCEVITSYQPVTFNFSDMLVFSSGTSYPAQRVGDTVYYYHTSSGSVQSRVYNGSANTVSGGVTVTSQIPSGYLAALAQGKDIGFTLEAFE